jgi:hypothetical protein
MTGRRAIEALTIACDHSVSEARSASFAKRRPRPRVAPRAGVALHDPSAYAQDRRNSGPMSKSPRVTFKFNRVAEGDWQIEAHHPGVEIRHIRGFKTNTVHLTIYKP